MDKFFKRSSAYIVVSHHSRFFLSSSVHVQKDMTATTCVIMYVKSEINIEKGLNKFVRNRYRLDINAILVFFLFLLASRCFPHLAR